MKKLRVQLQKTLDFLQENLVIPNSTYNQFPHYRM